MMRCAHCALWRPKSGTISIYDVLGGFMKTPSEVRKLRTHTLKFSMITTTTVRTLTERSVK